METCLSPCLFPLRTFPDHMCRLRLNLSLHVCVCVCVHERLLLVVTEGRADVQRKQDTGA